jgi:hypothetical protein
LTRRSADDEQAGDEQEDVEKRISISIDVEKRESTGAGRAQCEWSLRLPRLFSRRLLAREGLDGVPRRQ